MKNIFRSASLLFVFIGMGTFAFTIAGKIISADKSNSWVRYTVDHTLHKATAISNDFICNIDFNSDTKQINNVVAAVGIGTFDSKNSNRDSNAMEAVDALKFPSVKFISSSVSSVAGKLFIKGNLIFHGVTKEFHFDAEQIISGNLVTVTGSFTVSLDQFKVERPSLLGMKIDDTILVEFKTVFKI